MTRNAPEETIAVEYGKLLGFASSPQELAHLAEVNLARNSTVHQPLHIDQLQQRGTLLFGSPKFRYYYRDNSPYVNSGAYAHAFRCVDSLNGTECIVKIINIRKHREKIESQAKEKEKAKKQEPQAADVADAKSPDGGSGEGDTNSSEPSASSVDTLHREKVVKEVRNLRQISEHFGVTHLYHYEQMDGHALLFMEYCEMGDLRNFMEARRQLGSCLDCNEVRSILAQLTYALHHVHRRKMVHRDVTAANVLLHGNGLVKLGDFGLAKILDQESGLAVGFGGTPHYVAPEVWQKRPYTTKTDIWSLGIILYQMIGGIGVPFRAQSTHELSDRITTLNYQRLGDIPEVTARVPPGLIAVCESMLQLDPEKRPSTAELLLDPMIREVTEGFVGFVKMLALPPLFASRVLEYLVRDGVLQMQYAYDASQPDFSIDESEFDGSGMRSSRQSADGSIAEGGGGTDDSGEPHEDVLLPTEDDHASSIDEERRVQSSAHVVPFDAAWVDHSQSNPTTNGPTDADAGVPTQQLGQPVPAVETGTSSYSVSASPPTGSPLPPMAIPNRSAATTDAKLNHSGSAEPSPPSAPATQEEHQDPAAVIFKLNKEGQWEQRILVLEHHKTAPTPETEYKVVIYKSLQDRVAASRGDSSKKGGSILLPSISEICLMEQPEVITLTVYENEADPSSAKQFQVSLFSFRIYREGKGSKYDALGFGSQEEMLQWANLLANMRDFVLAQRQMQDNENENDRRPTPPSALADQ